MLFECLILLLFSADHIEVHVENLVEPCDTNLFRNPDVEHVKQLKKEMLERPNALFTLMACNIRQKPAKKDLSLLKLPGKARIEVIGGNHTRLAIQELNDDPDNDFKRNQCVVRLYFNLSQDMALHVAYNHNRYLF